MVIAVAQENLRAWQRNSTFCEDPSVVQKLVHTDVLPENRSMPPIKIHRRQHPFRRVLTVDSHCLGIAEDGQALEGFAQHPSTDQCQYWCPRSVLHFQNQLVPGRGDWVIPERLQPQAAWHFTNLIFTHVFDGRGGFWMCVFGRCLTSRNGSVANKIKIAHRVPGLRTNHYGPPRGGTATKVSNQRTDTETYLWCAGTAAASLTGGIGSVMPVCETSGQA